MPRTEQEIKEILARSMGEFAKELWTDDVIVAAFVERYAHDVAAQQTLALTATTEDKRREHRQNIQHLLEDMRSKAVARYIRIHGSGVHVFAAVLRAFISITINAVLIG